MVAKKKWWQMTQTDDANSSSVLAGPEQTFLGLVLRLVGCFDYILLQPGSNGGPFFLKIQFCQYKHMKYLWFNRLKIHFSQKTRTYYVFNRQSLGCSWETIRRTLRANKGEKLEPFIIIEFQMLPPLLCLLCRALPLYTPPPGSNSVACHGELETAQCFIINLLL